MCLMITGLLLAGIVSNTNCCSLNKIRIEFIGINPGSFTIYTYSGDHYIPFVP